MAKPVLSWNSQYHEIFSLQDLHNRALNFILEEKNSGSLMAKPLNALFQCVELKAKEVMWKNFQRNIKKAKGSHS